MARRPSIRLISGNHFYFDAPLLNTFTVEDIAHNIGKEPRFNGATVGDLAYTVAQHAVNVSYVVPPEFAFEALHHDDAEAFYKDVTTHLKRMMPEYREQLSLGELAVARFFGLPERMSHAVHEGDMLLLKLEKDALFPHFEGDTEEGFYHIEGVDTRNVSHMVDVEPWAPGVAKQRYLARHMELLNNG